MNPLTWVKDNVTAFIGGLMGIALLALGLWCGILTHQRNSARSALKACQNASAATVANFKRATAEAKADDLANARKVEQHYASIAEDQSHALQDQLARVRADAAAHVERLRASTGTAGGSIGKSSLSVPAKTAGRADAADPGTVMADDAQSCATSWVVATGWQDWYRAVSANEAAPVK